MIKILMFMFAAMLVVLAVFGSFVVQFAAIGALLCLGALVAIIRSARQRFGKIGLPDCGSSQAGQALDEFLEDRIRK